MLVPMLNSMPAHLKTTLLLVWELLSAVVPVLNHSLSSLLVPLSKKVLLSHLARSLPAHPLDIFVI